MIFWSLLAMVAVTILIDYLTPKPQQEGAKPKGLGDFNFPTADATRRVPVIFGRNLVKGPNVIDYGDLRADAIKERVRTGISSKKITRGFKYYLYVQFMICRGDDTGVTLRKVRIGETQVFSGTVSGVTNFDIDQPELLGGDDFGSGGIQATCDFFPGTKLQAVSTFLDTIERQQILAGPTNTAPRYTGTCYIVARELTGVAATGNEGGAYFGNNPDAVKTWEFEVERFPPIFSGQSAGEHKILTDDCNPMNVIYEVLTNTEWGFGQGASDIDVGVASSFVKASDTLISEGNGFSIVIDREMEASDLLAQVLAQIDGHLYIDPATGKWRITLVREASHSDFGYDINTVPQLDDDSIVEVTEWTNGDWADTTNQVFVRYFDRGDDYQEKLAPAQSSGNAILMSGGSIASPRSSPSEISYPGVRTKANANRLAWRDLDGRSRPLVRATFKTSRITYTSVIGDVVAWTDAEKGFDKLPMRIVHIDYGTPKDQTITVKAVQDIWAFQAASSGDPPDTGWVPPSTTLVAFPSDEQIAIEAPRGLIVRDPDFEGDEFVARVLCAARRQTDEVAFEINQRNAAGTPAGSFAFAGSVVDFMRIGSLKAELKGGSAIPTATITIETDPDNIANLNGVFDNGISLEDLGTSLTHLVLIGSEFMLVHTSGISGSDVTLDDVYRGVLGTGQTTHAASSPVFLVFVGAGMTAGVYPNTNNIDIELRMRTATSLFAGSVTTVSFQFDKRSLRPYPPSASLYSGSGTPFTTPDLEADGSGLNGVGFDIDVRRRRYDTTDEVDEQLADQSGVSASTEHRVRIFVDPSGSNTLVYNSGWFSGTSPSPSPTQAEIIVGGAAGTEIRIASDSRHDIEDETQLESFEALHHDVVPTSSRSAQFFLGGDLRANDVSNSYVAAATGTFTINIGAAYSTSDVEVRINGGSWVVEILAGGTSGSFSATTSDTIEVRHTVNETPDPNFVEIQNPSAVAVAYGAFSA